MATVTAYLSTKVDQRGKAEIRLRFVGGRGCVHRLHSRLWVEPSRFKDGVVVVPRMGGPQQREALEIRASLEDMRTRLLEWFATADPAAVTREALQQVLTNRKGVPASFFDAWESFSAARDVSAGRRKHYATVGDALRRFEQHRHARLSLDALTPADLDAFRDFILEEPEHKQRSRNYATDCLKIVRAFWRWCLERKITANDPFVGFKIGAAVYGTPYYLTIEERDALYAYDLGRFPRLEVQRDVFIFQCLTGCRYGDLARFKATDVVDGVLEYIPRKSSEGRPVVVRVPLTATAREIVERYEGLAGDKLLPVAESHKYNDAIKTIFEKAGLARPVAVLNPVTRKEEKRPLCEVASSHLARRTFVGNLYRQVKDPALVGSLSGHAEGSRAFARYRAIDDDLKRQTVELLEK